MLNYVELNLNPKKRKTGDCSTRAISAVLGIDYADALRLQYEESSKCFYDPTSKQVVARVLAKFGYAKVQQPKKSNGKKYLVKEIDQITTKAEREKGILVTVANHHTCVYNNSIIDIWNCGNKTIGNYYVRCQDIKPKDIKYSTEVINKLINIK